jgi:hypothetical protein
MRLLGDVPVSAPARQVNPASSRIIADRPSIGCRTGLEIEIDAAPGLL